MPLTLSLLPRARAQTHASVCTCYVHTCIHAAHALVVQTCTRARARAHTHTHTQGLLRRQMGVKSLTTRKARRSLALRPTRPLASPACLPLSPSPSPSLLLLLLLHLLPPTFFLLLFHPPPPPPPLSSLPPPAILISLPSSCLNAGNRDHCVIMRAWSSACAHVTRRFAALPPRASACLTDWLTPPLPSSSSCTRSQMD